MTGGSSLEALIPNTMTIREVNAVSSLGLAHVGDAVYEILVRSMLILDGNTTSAHLHRETINLVCAPAQSRAAEVIMPSLSDEEQGFYRRGRNATVHNIPKNATHSQYSRATGLEALFGALYLLGRTDRIKELFHLIQEDYYAT